MAMPKVIFRKVRLLPLVHSQAGYGGEFVAFQLGPDIRNNSRNKNTGNNSTILSVRGNERKAENGERKENENSENGVRREKENKQK